jgi:hypothetical protein
VEPPAGVPPAEPPAEDPYRCFRCGAPHDAFQEYCLECGARLVPLRAGAAWSRTSWGAQSPFWFWATFLGLLLIALVAAAIVIAATDDDDGEAQRPATSAPGPTSSIAAIPTDLTVTTAPLTDTGILPLPPATTATVPTFPGTTSIQTDTGTTGSNGTTATTTTVQTTTTATTTTGGSGTVTSWPSGRDGYTVVLASIPTSQGRSAAESRARQAIANGLDEVGVLNSSDYASLRAGYYVVFAGIYSSAEDAAAAVPAARSAGYPRAYRTRVAAG